MRTAPLLAGAVATTALAGLALRGPTPAPYDGPVALAAPDAASPLVDWPAVVAALDAARAAAFAEPAAADPAAWADPRCPCHADDQHRLAALAALGRGLDVAAVAVTDLTAETEGEQVTLTFTDRLPPYAELDGAGRVVRAWPGRGPQRWRGVLVQVDGAWRWRDLAPVPDDHDPARRVDPRSPG